MDDFFQTWEDVMIARNCAYGHRGMDCPEDPGPVGKTGGAAIDGGVCSGLESHAAGQPKQVLVVDDNLFIRDLVGEILAAAGHRVDTAMDGSRAMDLMSSRRYDLVVTDLDMPGMNGFHLVSNIKKRYRTIKAVIMTGRCQAEVADLHAQGIVDAWLFKPFDLDDILCLMQRFEPSPC